MAKASKAKTESKAKAEGSAPLTPSEQDQKQNPVLPVGNSGLKKFDKFKNGGPLK